MGLTKKNEQYIFRVLMRKGEGGGGGGGSTCVESEMFLIFGNISDLFFSHTHKSHFYFHTQNTQKYTVSLFKIYFLNSCQDKLL